MVEIVNDLRRLSLLLVLFAFPAAADAHRLDEYLQATLVEIEPNQVRVEINLTPGIQVADQVFSAIDTDHDGVISPSEAAAYADLLRRDLTLRIDERKVELKLLATKFPDAAELRGGLGIIQIAYSASVVSLDGGKHKLTLRNRHLPGVSVYLINAAQPKSDAIEIVGQRRNRNQSDGEIDFTVKGTTSPTRIVGLAALLSIVSIIVIAALWPKRRRETAKGI